MADLIGHDGKKICSDLLPLRSNSNSINEVTEHNIMVIGDGFKQALEQYKQKIFENDHLPIEWKEELSLHCFWDFLVERRYVTSIPSADLKEKEEPDPLAGTPDGLVG